MLPALVAGVQRRTSHIIFRHAKGGESVANWIRSDFSSQSAWNGSACEDQIILSGMVFHAYHGVLPEVRFRRILWLSSSMISASDAPPCC
jgi:hypothetical protein